METLAQGTIQGLANHTVLIARNGSECAIADSCAPIRDRDGHVIGAVLVFRDVTEEYAAQQTLEEQQVELELQNEELRTSQEALHLSQERYVDLYDFAPVGYCTVSEQGLILAANLTAATLLGLPRGELIKQPISRFIFKEDADIYYLLHKQLSKAAEAQKCELRMVNDGTLIWVQLSVTAAQDNGAPVLRIVMSDINERKRAEEALLKAGALQSAIFNSANFSSIATDAKGVIQIFNVGAERMLGYAAADVMNKITPGRDFRSAGSDCARESTEHRTRDPDCAGLRGVGIQGFARHRRYLRTDLHPQGRQPLPGSRVGHRAARRSRRHHWLPADRHR